MRKKLLAIGALAFVFSAQAQSTATLHVDNNTLMLVQDGTLLTDIGGLQTKGTGLLDVWGNVMVVGNSDGSSQFRTLDASGNPLTTVGQNIILRMSDTGAGNEFFKYGQLYITQIPQENITGFVNKEYRAYKNGSMQQMAIPFYNKSFTELAKELGVTGGFSNTRNNNAVGYYDNTNVVMHNLPGTATTLSNASKDPAKTWLDDQEHSGDFEDHGDRYYAIGTANWDPATKHVVTGVPQSDQNTGAFARHLVGAGYKESETDTPINYGVATGAVKNMYNERYNTYLQDSFDTPTTGYFNGTTGSESGTFGRNIYQMGNPYLTNLDIANLWKSDSDDFGDGNAIKNLYGIRYLSSGVTTTTANGTKAAAIRYVTYSLTDGTMVGDTNYSYIQPMGAFVIKLRDNRYVFSDFSGKNTVATARPLANGETMSIINYPNLRRFAYGNRATATDYSVTAARNANAAKDTSKGSISTGTLKQLRIIGLNASGNEVGRTYYVVSPNLTTGSAAKDVQVAATNGAISTREELPAGGTDQTALTRYWLYINGANEQDYKGKPVEMVVDNSTITNYKIEIDEAGKNIGDRSSTLSTGEKFYINQNGAVTELANNATVKATSGIALLYYGAPVKEQVLGTTETSTTKDATLIAYDEFGENYKVLFAPSWKTAKTIEIYDMAGKLISRESNVNAKETHTLALGKVASGAYLVRLISDAGEVVQQKILVK